MNSFVTRTYKLVGKDCRLIKYRILLLAVPGFIFLFSFLFLLFSLETILWFFQIYFCKSGRCCFAAIDTAILPCNPPSGPLAPLLTLTLWLTFAFVHFWSHCCPGSSQGCSLCLQQSQTGAAGEGSNAVGASMHLHEERDMWPDTKGGFAS